MDPLPAPGPSLIDFYMPDRDRHASGLHCFPLDHRRGLLDRDPEVGPLQTAQAAEDDLTESESDEEEGGGGAGVPGVGTEIGGPLTMETAKLLLAKSAVEQEVVVRSGKRGERSSISAPVTDEQPALTDVERKYDQVIERASVHPIGVKSVIC